MVQQLEETIEVEVYLEVNKHLVGIYVRRMMIMTMIVLEIEQQEQQQRMIRYYYN